MLCTKGEPEQAKEIGCLNWEVDSSEEDQFETVCQNLMDTLGTAGIAVN